MLAKGGLVTAPTLAMLGEAGPEAVVPLGRSGFADEIAQAVYQAIMDAIRISRASSSQSSDDKELVLKIDNTVLAWMQLPALVREGQRQGLDLLPEVAIQAVGEVTDWITNLPEVAIQAVGEVTDWIISLPEVAVNATGRVMSWIVDLSTLAVNAVGYITEWVTNVPELETPIEAIARITKWVVDSIPDITLLGHIDLENIPIPITPISLNPPPRQIIQTPQFPQEGLQTVNTVRDDTHFADTVAQAVYRAVMDAIRITQASSGQSGNDDKELVLKIDNTVLARMQLPAIIREGQRQGLDLVVRPQGV